MKKVALLSLSVLFALTMTLKGQPGGGMPSAEDMAKRETEQMKTSVGITQDQLPQVEAINLKYAQKRSELFQNGPGGDFEQIRAKMQENQKLQRAEFEKVLTADQLKKYDTMIEERRQRGPGGPR